LFWLLGKVLSFIPGWGTAAKFVMKFGQYLFSFITTQIMLIWSKRKADSEAEAEAKAKALKFTGKSILNKITRKLFDIS
jgi:nicotinamide riboside transporter PnuC